MVMMVKLNEEQCGDVVSMMVKLNEEQCGE